MRYRVLGPVEASSGDEPARLGGPKQRLVLALLLVDAGRTVSDERLIDGVWGEDPPDQARHALQTHVSELRRFLDDELRRENGGYRMVLDRNAVDAHRFESLAAAGRARLADAPAGAAALLREALELWRGDPYADLAIVPALQPEVHRLQEVRLAAVEDRIQADLDSGRHAEVSWELEALIREHPYRERLQALHMLALYRSGRQADALGAFERARSILADELGIDPSHELQSLHHRILTQDPELHPAGTPGSTETPSIRNRTSPSTPPDLEVVPGFELRERVGRGDFGTVYRAYQASIGREVAVKVIRREHAGSAAFVRSFERRAAHISQLDHPSIAPLLDYWRDPKGAYLVMPWFRAGSLRRALQRGPWSLPATLRMLGQVGRALAFAHRHGVVHGDVKANNVFIDADGNAELGDFQVTDRPMHPEDGSDANRSRVETPEQRRYRQDSPSSDVYGLGLLAVESLLGSAPGAYDPTSSLRQRRSDLPAKLVEALARATATDPGARYERVEELVRDLHLAAGADVVGLPPSDEDRMGPVRNPYKGLRPFQESDAPDFFGREALVERLVDTVRANRLVAVVGPSGSGKSSVVRAGLVPALRAGALPGSSDWLVTEMFPGSHPFEELEAALVRIALVRPEELLADLRADDRGMLQVLKRILPSDESELVLVVDQFEELFSLTNDPEVRRRFIEGLVTLASDGRGRVRTVLTLRADFFDRPLEHYAFGELVRAGLVPVTMSSPAELALAISRPAIQAGVDFESGLIGQIVHDVADQPGGLPLLQHALTELFARREEDTLTGQGYRSTGGVLGALGRRAEELYRSLSPEGRRVARQVFLRLVTVDEQTEDARRRVRRSELAGLAPEPATVNEVIREFGAHRLLSFDRDPVGRSPTVEVAHESLFREWETLRGWIDSRREDLLLHRRLAAAVGEWRLSGRSQDYVLTGGRLEGFERWADGTDLALTEEEREYLRASRAREDGLAAARRRRRRSVVAVSLFAATVGIALATFALVLRDRAAQGERVARARALAAASRIQTEVDHDLAVLLSLEAVEVSRAEGEPPLREAVQALHDAVLAHRLVQTADVGGFLTAFVGDGTRMFTTGPPTMRPLVWDIESREQVLALESDDREPNGYAVSTDGRLAAEVYADGAPARIWDLETGQIRAELHATGYLQWRPAFSPDGRSLAFLDFVRRSDGSGSDEVFLSIWDLASEEERIHVPVSADPTDTAFGPDGKTIAVADARSAISWLYDASTGESVRTVGDETDPRSVSSIAFEPSGRLVMYLSGPGEIRVLNTESNRPELILPVGADANHVCVTGDGRAIAATAADEVIRVWDTATGDLLMMLPGTSLGGILDCAPRATMIASATSEGVVRVWDITDEGEAEVLSFGTPRPFTAAWDPGGEALISNHHDGTLRRYDARTGVLIAQARDGASWVTVSPDGRYIAGVGDRTGDGDPGEAPVTPNVVLYDAATLERVRVFEAPGQPLAFTNDSALLFVGGEAGAGLYDVASGLLVRELLPPGVDATRVPISAAAMHPEGNLMVVTPFDRPEAWVFEIDTGDLIAAACPELAARRVAIGPDGRMLAIAHPNGVEIWDLEAILARGYPAGCSPGARPSDSARMASFAANAWIGMEFSPDGARLATAGFDGVVGLWDPRTGATQLRITHDGQVGGAGFSPDGRHLLATVSRNQGSHAIQIYTLDLEELVSIAEHTVTRGFTEAECQEHLQLPRCPGRGGASPTLNGQS